MSMDVLKEGVHRYVCSVAASDTLRCAGTWSVWRSVTSGATFVIWRAFERKRLCCFLQVEFSKEGILWLYFFVLLLPREETFTTGYCRMRVTVNTQNVRDRFTGSCKRTRRHIDVHGSSGGDVKDRSFLETVNVWSFCGECDQFDHFAWGGYCTW